MGNPDEKSAERKNLTMPPDWWEAFENAARAAGKSLSEWVGWAARKALPPEQRKRLTGRTRRGRPAKGDDDA